MEREWEIEMIRINETWCISVDPLNYIVCKDLHKTDKSGRPLMDNVGYFETLLKALAFIIKRSDKDVLSGNEEISLTEAIEKLNRNHAEMIELIQKTVPEVGIYPSNGSIRA